MQDLLFLSFKYIYQIKKYHSNQKYTRFIVLPHSGCETQAKAVKKSSSKEHRQPFGDHMDSFISQAHTDIEKENKRLVDTRKRYVYHRWCYILTFHYQDWKCICVWLQNHLTSQSFYGSGGAFITLNKW